MQAGAKAKGQRGGKGFVSSPRGLAAGEERRESGLWRSATGAGLPRPRCKSSESLTRSQTLTDQPGPLTILAPRAYSNFQAEVRRRRRPLPVPLGGASRWCRVFLGPALPALTWFPGSTLRWLHLPCQAEERSARCCGPARDLHCPSDARVVHLPGDTFSLIVKCSFRS